MIPFINHDSQGSGGRREVVIKFTQIDGHLIDQAIKPPLHPS